MPAWIEAAVGWRSTAKTDPTGLALPDSFRNSLETLPADPG